MNYNTEKNNKVYIYGEIMSEGYEAGRIYLCVGAIPFL